MVRERLIPTAVLNSWKAPHCGALWAGRARKRLRPFILHKIERAEMRSDPSKNASVRPFAHLCTNALRSSKRVLPSTHSASPAGSHTAAHTGEQGVFQMGVVCEERMQRAFGTETRIARVSVPRRRGPAGLRCSAAGSCAVPASFTVRYRCVKVQRRNVHCLSRTLPR